MMKLNTDTLKASALTRRHLLAGAAALSAPWLSSHAAQPVAGGRTVTLVVSYPVGGGADLIARTIAPHMAKALGQNVVVDNKPGASGQLAAGLVARAAADGTSLLLDASSFAVNPSLYPKLPYDSEKAFTPLAILATFPNVLVVTPGFRAKTVAELIQQAKSAPNEIAYASSGNGSAQHLAGALFEDQAGVRLSHIPYRGGGPALNDVMAGQVPLFFANVASSLGHIQSGRLRALAVTSKTRVRSLPDVPTMVEAGLPNFQVLEWNPVLAPAGLDEPSKAALMSAIQQALAHPDVVARIHQLGGDVSVNHSSASAAQFIQEQKTQWARVVRERNIVVG